MRDREKEQHRVSVEHLMEEFDELRNTVLEADLVELMKQQYGLSDRQSHLLINEAKDRTLLMETSRFGKRGYLKRDTRFSPIDVEE
ncbi:MAG TPA: hypothetical protein VFZ67_01980 [Nitrososphaera sp.]